MQCEQCGGEAVNETELIARFKRLGIGYKEFGDQSSNPYGVSQRNFDAIERLKGFQCKECGNVYCMNCIKLDAVQLRQIRRRSGGSPTIRVRTRAGE